MSTLVSVTARNRRLLWITFGLTFAYFCVEVVGGVLTNSLALLADAAHNSTTALPSAAWISTPVVAVCLGWRQRLGGHPRGEQGQSSPPASVSITLLLSNKQARQGYDSYPTMAMDFIFA